MKPVREAPRLHRLTRFGAINAYLVTEDDGLTLVDTGLSGLAPAFLDGARRLGAPITRVTLTHAHGDHAGSWDALREALPEAEFSAGQREQRLLEEERRLDPDEPPAKVRGSWPTLAHYPDRLLADGDRVGSLRVVFSPGHTPGHVAYLDERDGTLIAGDAFQTLGGIAVSGQIRPLFPLVAMATWHKPTAVSSAATLRALQPSRLAVGHGKVLDEPLSAMDKAIAAAR